MDLLDDDTSERALWLQLSRETIPHADLADGLMRMARANPLSPHVCLGVIAEVFHRKLQTYWPRRARKLAQRNLSRVISTGTNSLRTSERLSASYRPILRCIIVGS